MIEPNETGKIVRKISRQWCFIFIFIFIFIVIFIFIYNYVAPLYKKIIYLNIIRLPQLKLGNFEGDVIMNWQNKYSKIPTILLVHKCRLWKFVINVFWLILGCMLCLSYTLPLKISKLLPPATRYQTPNVQNKMQNIVTEVDCHRIENDGVNLKKETFTGGGNKKIQICCLTLLLDCCLIIFFSLSLSLTVVFDILCYKFECCWLVHFYVQYSILTTVININIECFYILIF